MKPILFNTDMVRAILAGRKTVTRRVVNHKHLRGLENLSAEKIQRACVLPYRPGDILYVRETWALIPDDGYKYRYSFRANEENIPIERWYPSIHMPKEAARIFLRVTDVRVERLQEIDEDGSIAEGCSAGRFETTGGPWGVEDDPDEWTAREDFSHVWDSTIKPADRERYGWAANPWVWVIEFERCEKPKEG